MFFRILESGCKLEAQQLATLKRLERGLAIYPIIAWRILPRGGPLLVTLGEVVALEGRCDGHPRGGPFGHKRDGPPGPEALWQGLQCVMNPVEALQTVGDFQDSERSCG